MSTANSPLAEKVSLARATRNRAQDALQRNLEPGEMRDFLMDNFEDWSRADIEAVRDALITPDPRDPDPSREGMWRYHNCSYCDDGRKPCKQGGAHRCSNPHARND